MKNKKKLIGSIIVFLIFASFLFIGSYISRPPKEGTNNDIFKDSSEVLSTDAKKISVYVNGEVKNPGVYQLDSNSRVLDAINSSGGFTDSADKARLNLAKKLKDEDHIYVDSKNPNGRVAAVRNDGIININVASKEELMKLPGVGEVTAQKIIDYREKNGSFSSVEDLKKVDRIGDKTLEKFKDKIEAR